ncbi:4'-phosphopantetheinyl transferase superfamily protein [Treponema sp. TIM-1]|uniref:4'-phosphopantetheinyl transferase family protein n=1 Tax=Treponema sp. TIM-1 TaxID=2898417 RepID=UPI00397EF86D
MAIFYLGLSYGSNQNPEYRGQKGRRILRELDLRAGKSKAPGLGQEEVTKGAESLILTETGGRPYFADRHADFSISHSKRAVAVSYLGSFPGRRFRTGCDIQYQQPKKAYREIGAHFFHPPEQEVLAAAGADGLCFFYRLWVLKEAYLKLRGLSVFDLCRSPVFSFDGESGGEILPEASQDRGEPGEAYFFSGASGDGRDLEFFLYETGDPAGNTYSLAVCRERDELDPATEPELRWFSREKLPLKSIAKIKAAERPIKTVRPKI